MNFGKLEWIVSALSVGYIFRTLYLKAHLVYVNVPYFSEIVDSNDQYMKQWMYTNSAELLIFGFAAFILGLFLLRSFKSVWLKKKEGDVEKVEKVKGKRKKEEIIEPERKVIRFD